MKYVKLFEQFTSGEEKFIWLGFPTDDSGYSAGVVTKEEAEKLEMLDHGSIEPLGDNVYVYIDLGQVEMRPETSDFDIEGLSYISANGEDNHDDEPDYDRLVIELPQEGIITTNPDGYSWNAQLLSVDDYIQNAGDDEDEVRIELSNSYTLVGPKENEEEARRIIAEMENEMKSAYDEALENSGESAAMDARDDVYWENGYKEILSKIGFEMEDEY